MNPIAKLELERAAEQKARKYFETEAKRLAAELAAANARAMQYREALQAALDTWNSGRGGLSVILTEALKEEK